MKPIKIGWLSDIHFKNEYFQAPLKPQVEAFFKAIGKLFNQEMVTHVVISGDIACKGERGEYAAIQDLLSDHLNHWPIVMVPGNHDCNWDHQFLATSKTDLDRLYKLDAKEINDTSKRYDKVFEYYGSFAEQMMKSWGHWTPNRVLNGHLYDEKSNVLFLLLNSAWRSIGLKALDEAFKPFYDNLIKTTDAWQTLSHMLDGDLKQMGNQSYFLRELEWGVVNNLIETRNPWVISVAHHPPSWLNWKDANGVGQGLHPISELLEKSDLLLTGHLHAPIIQTSVLEGTCIHLAGCCLIDHKPLNPSDSFNGFPGSALGIVEIDGGHITPVTYKPKVVNASGIGVLWEKEPHKWELDDSDTWMPSPPQKFPLPQKQRNRVPDTLPTEPHATPLPTIQNFLQELNDRRGVTLSQVGNMNHRVLNLDTRLEKGELYYAHREETMETYLFAINVDFPAIGKEEWIELFKKEALWINLYGKLKLDEQISPQNGKQEPQEEKFVVAFYDCYTIPIHLRRSPESAVSHFLSPHLEEKTIKFHGFKAHYFADFPKWENYLDLPIIHDCLFFSTTG